MLEFHPLKEQQAPPERLAELLREAKAVLLERGMASMDEYGDMLQWPLPRRDDVWRKFHVFHPGMCSFDDRFWGTIHYHAGWIRGTLLLGGLQHHTYRAEKRPDGDRFHHGEAYRLTRHTREQRAGTAYELPARVPHWITPLELTLTYFEEEVTAEAADLVNPASEELDEHRWTQAEADALLPRLVAAIDERVATLSPLTAHPHPNANVST